MKVLEFLSKFNSERENIQGSNMTGIVRKFAVTGNVPVRIRQLDMRKIFSTRISIEIPAIGAHLLGN